MGYPEVHGPMTRRCGMNGSLGQALLVPVEGPKTLIHLARNFLIRYQFKFLPASQADFTPWIIFGFSFNHKWR